MARCKEVTRWPWLVAALMISPAWADPSPLPLGPGFQVNNRTTNQQRLPAVRIEEGGGFVVVWESNGSDGGDSSGYSIQARRFAADGLPLAAQFQVNSFTTGAQAVARSPLALAGGGNFIVAWDEFGSFGSDLNVSVQGQLHSDLGSPIDSQFQVNTYTPGTQEIVSVASLSAGGFLATWESVPSAGPDNSSRSIQAQRYSAAAVPQALQFEVNSYTTNDQTDPVAFPLADDGFVVLWTSLGSATDSSGTSVQAQRYSAAGAPAGGQFQVNTYTTSEQLHATGASRAGGGFVVVWESYPAGGADTSQRSIQGQLFDASASPVGGQFEVNSFTLGSQRYPSVAGLEDGGFLVVWQSLGADTGDNLTLSIQAQSFSADGIPDGPQFQVNTYTTGGQYFPKVDAAPGGSVAVVWQSNGSAGGDTSFHSIQARLFHQRLIFADGFQSGTVGAWGP